MTDKLPEIGKRYKHCTNHIPCEVDCITDEGYIIISWPNSPSLREDIFYPNSLYFWETFEEIPEQEPVSEWQPIETAPKDGTYILLFNESIIVGFWNGDSWDDGDFHNYIDDVTHWMPLPKPPTNNK